MATPLNPQEIYLLERYSSLEYFAEMRDAWSSMVSHAEDCLAAFTSSLPPDYRKRPHPVQPDIVWGERVLVNFRDTLHGLNEAFIRLTHGDVDALSYANGVHNDTIALRRDYSAEWMNEPHVAAVIPRGSDTFYAWMGEASRRATNICATHGAYWSVTELTSQYSDAYRGPLNAPASWPTYRSNEALHCRTGQSVTRTGIYLPVCDDAAAALLIEGQLAPPAAVGYDAARMQSIREQDTLWIHIERASDSGGGTPGAADPSAAGVLLRCEAGQECIREGFWSTPARVGSRRRFASGEVMPSVGSDYGTTIWQWDDDQISP